MGCNTLFYFPTRINYVPPEKLNLKYQDYSFPTSDSLKIHGRIIFHSDSISRKGLIVLFHGNAQNLTAHYLQFVWALKRGYDLFIFDYPGYGLSEGNTTRRNSIESGRAALEFVGEKFMSDTNQNLILVGESLGGAILLRAFDDWNKKTKTTLLIAESTFPSYRRAARSVLAKQWLTWPLQPLTYLLISEEGSPWPVIPRIAPTPLLVVTCAEDPVMNPKVTKEIYTQAKAPKFYWAFPACTHIQGFRTLERQNRLISFIDSLSFTRRDK